MQGESLKMTFHKKAEKTKRSLDPMEADKGTKVLSVNSQLTLFLYFIYLCSGTDVTDPYLSYMKGSVGSEFS